MIWDTLKKSLLTELRQRIDSKADEADRDSLHNLCASFYGRFPAEDMRERSVENLYGCLYGLLRFMHSWPDTSAKDPHFQPGDPEPWLGEQVHGGGYPVPRHPILHGIGAGRTESAQSDDTQYRQLEPARSGAMRRGNWWRC